MFYSGLPKFRPYINIEVHSFQFEYATDLRSAQCNSSNGDSCE